MRLSTDWAAPGWPASVAALCLPGSLDAALWIDRTPADFRFDIKAYALLTQLVADRDLGEEDLRRMAGIGRVYWDAAPSQWYAEPKRLAKLGREHERLWAGYLERLKAQGLSRD